MNVWSILMPTVQGSHSHIHKNQKVDSFFLRMTMVRKLCYCNPNNVATHSPTNPKEARSNPPSWGNNPATTIHETSRSFLHIFSDLHLYVCILRIERGVRKSEQLCLRGERGEREKENLDRFKRRTLNPKPFLPSTIAPAFLGFFRNILPKSI